MSDINAVFAGRIHSPNPFWLASGPPTNCGEQVMRAFDAGWGGAVWKTLGEPIDEFGLLNCGELRRLNVSRRSCRKRPRSAET